uniref:Ribonuclease VapC n=1 Tax=Candidatus Kentrum sp. DK TaxID=2126562 RepID=A0A450TNF4_9GAMM|nr:MAG: hypothetical protein BECKDK2373C_GA0170839_12134 [Candidatus Kentron sp. DK]
MLLDTDVLIWYMRGDENARDLVDGLSDVTLSAVTYMELVQGMRNKVELAALDTALARWNAKPEAIGREISEHAVLLVRRYFLSHSLRMADALIAATALELNRPLITANDKHYRMIDGLDLVIFRPRQ